MIASESRFDLAVQQQTAAIKRLEKEKKSQQEI
jgi:hypothetical protein